MVLSESVLDSMDPEHPAYMPDVPDRYPVPSQCPWCLARAVDYPREPSWWETYLYTCGGRYHTSRSIGTICGETPKEIAAKIRQIADEENWPLFDALIGEVKNIDISNVDRYDDKFEFDIDTIYLRTKPKIGELLRSTRMRRIGRDRRNAKTKKKALSDKDIREQLALLALPFHGEICMEIKNDC